MSGTEFVPQQTAWPEGVIGRYLTLTGATVDLTEQGDGIFARCTACPNSQREISFDPMCAGVRAEGWATDQAGQWAQQHAEKCRALPRPASV
ncbi:hypothetical protein ABZ769_28135 [Streptomyces olivoreticuli]